MAVEVAGFEMVQGPVETGAEGGKPVLHEKENGKPEVPIKFGSHGDESVKGLGDEVSESNAPKDAAEEWPAPKQIHSFYFVRCRPYGDPNITTKINQLRNEITRKNKARSEVTEALKAKRAERAELISQIRALRGDSRQYQSLVDEKMKEIEPLQQALGKFRISNTAVRGGGICSTEEELNDIIYSLQYRIQHESITLAEEKQILREIKQLEGSRDKVVANVTRRTKLQKSMGQEEDIQDRVKLIGGDLDGAKKKRQAIRSQINEIDEDLKIIDKDIQSLQDELAAIMQIKEQAVESIQKLRKQGDDGNTHFHQSRNLLNKARELAAKKDVASLEDLLQTEVEKFMSLWNSDKSFRNDYEKRLLGSLDMRQLSRDGRMRNPDEKPLLEETKPANTVAAPKAVLKQPKEEVLKQPKEEPKASHPETLPAQAVQKEAKNKSKDLKSKQEKNSAEADEYEFENPHKEAPAKKEPEIDPAKLKEIKREEEIAKAKQALERKKKLAEKAAAKAAARAQKEAEKKLKDREKKLKKKALGSATAPNAEEPEQAAVEAVEEQKIEENVEVPAPVEVKEKAPKVSNVRSRGRAKGPDSVHKVVLKRKKANNNWMWISSAAALSVLLVLVLAYNYLY